MSVRSLNGLAGSNNIYINTLSATLPLEIQSSNDTSSTLSIKGLSGFGTAGQIIKVNSSANAFEYADDSTSNWTLNSGVLYPNSNFTKVVIGNNAIETGFNFEVNGDTIHKGLIVIQDPSNQAIRIDNTQDGGSSYTTGLYITSARIASQNYIEIDSPLLTGANGSEQRGVIRGYDYLNNANNHYIHVPNITTDTNIILPSSTGTLALTNQLYWTLNSSNLYPSSTSNNVLIGKTSASGGNKLEVQGNTRLDGNVDLVGNNLNNVDYITFPDASDNYTITLQAQTTTGNFPLYLPNSIGILALQYSATSPLTVNNTNHTISLSTIPVSLGGTNQTSYTDGQLLIGNSTGNTLSKSTLTAGNGISITNGNGSITIANTSSSQWTYDSGNDLLYPTSTSTKMVIGNNAISAGFEFENNGDFNNTGNITTTSFTSGAVVLQDPSDSGIRFDVYNSGNYIAGRFIKPLRIGAAGYIEIDFPIITGISSTINRMAFRDQDHSNMIYLRVPDVSSDVNVVLPSDSGTLALQSQFTSEGNFGTTSTGSTFGATGYTTTLQGQAININGDIVKILYNGSERFFMTSNVLKISNEQLTLDYDNIHTSSAVPTNGKVCLDVITPQGSTSNDNVYVSKSRYNMSGNTSSSFTHWMYNQPSQSREYYGISYWSGSGNGSDIYSLEKNGNMNIAGGLSENSDSRIKTNIEDADLDECVDVLKSIKLKKYNYTDDYIATYGKTTEKVYGFLADDIVDNAYISAFGKADGKPMVLKNNDGSYSRTLDNFKTIQKPQILSILWGCCNKFALENENLKSRIETLEDEIEAIKILLENNNIV